MFAGVMHFIYLDDAGQAFVDIGAPGHDSFYHVKMAALMPEIGLIETFPWLRTTLFFEKFINHHYGFQWLMLPMVRLAYQTTGDGMAGGRWFMTLSFGLAMALFNLLLMIRRIELRWIWLILCLLLPSQFYGRHAFVRAIDPSLVCMLLLCACMFTRRYVLAGVVIAGSVHVYMGAITYAPILVAMVFIAGLAGLIGEFLERRASWSELREDLRRFDGWRLVAWTAGGWLIGLMTHPYGGLDGLDFLKVQVFGSGLSPEIEVGREWNSYSPAWFFAQMSGITLIVTAMAICIRFRFGPKLERDEWALLMIGFVFFGLTLKARRFIEYWPLFSTLSSAYLAGPVFDRWRSGARLVDHSPLERPAAGESDSNATSTSLGSGVRRNDAYGASRPGWMIATVTLTALTVALGLWSARLNARWVPDSFGVEYRFWAFLAGLATFHLPVRTVSATTSSIRRRLAAAITAGGYTLTVQVVVGGLVWMTKSDEAAVGQLHIHWSAYVFLILAQVFRGLADVSASLDSGVRRNDAWKRSRLGIRRGLWAVAVTSAVSTLIVIPLGVLFGGLQRDTRCQYDLPAIRSVMETLVSVSREGAVVFTDDWDIFPVYFYVNHHNHYVVGLDPKFSHEKDPILWERYVRITRGETPTTRTVSIRENGKSISHSVRIELSDIREFFHAEYVIVDRDHRPFSRQLDKAPTLAQRISLPGDEKSVNPPYRLYRIVPTGETGVVSESSVSP